MQHHFRFLHNKRNVDRGQGGMSLRQRKYQYQYVAQSLEGLIQQVAVGYVARGYQFWVSGTVPRRLSCEEHDRRLIEKFEIAKSKWSRYRRKQRGKAAGREFANVQYIRLADFWLILATKGEHRFFIEHGVKEGRTVPEYQDIRERPISYGGYSIGWNRDRLTVRMTPRAYQELKDYYLAMATRFHSVEMVEVEFSKGPFEPYGGVTRQMFSILRAVNRARGVAGLKQVSNECIRVKRKSLKPFGEKVCPVA